MLVKLEELITGGSLAQVKVHLVRIDFNSPLGMHRQIAAGLQDGEVFAGERISTERVDIAILRLFGRGRGGLVSLELGQGRTLIGAVGVLVHVGQVGVVLGITGVHLLALCASPVFWI